MNLIKQLTSKLLIVCLILSFPSILPLKGMSQSSEIEEPLSQESTKAQNNEGGGIFRPKRSEGGSHSWQEIETVLLKRSGVFNRKKSPGGSRSGDTPLCLISPQQLIETETVENASETPIEIWSDRPLFIWQDNSLEYPMLILYSAEDVTEVWAKKLTSGENYITYDRSDALQPGETYQWQLSQYSVQFPTESVKILFKVMETEKRDAIRQDLLTIEQQFAEESPEVIALEKASYFRGKELWSDALQIMFSVDDPSEELQETINRIQSHNFCSS